MNEVCYNKIHYSEIQSWNVSHGLNGFEIGMFYQEARSLCVKFIAYKSYGHLCRLLTIVTK